MHTEKRDGWQQWQGYNQQANNNNAGMANANAWSQQQQQQQQQPGYGQPEQQQPNYTPAAMQPPPPQQQSAPQQAQGAWPQQVHCSRSSLAAAVCTCMWVVCVRFYFCADVLR